MSIERYTIILNSTNRVKHSIYLLLSLLAETTNGRANSDRGSSIESISTTGLGFVAGLAFPDTNDSALHAKLAAEAAEVFGVLANFDFLNLLTQRGTITGAVFTDNPDLLCALRLQRGKYRNEDKRLGYYDIKDLTGISCL
jgi:hypothetical protein